MDIVGKHIRYCVDQAGCGGNSHIHAVGDGATWIAQQIEKQFACKSTYLIDFYHASEYLAAASHECSPHTPKKWLTQQQELLKAGQYEPIIQMLLNQASSQDSATYKCYQYLHKRTHQLQYDVALKRNLPIGSGEIESAHRYVIQNRIKITGAWWLLDNADAMINLSTLRANQHWDAYWAKT